MPVYTNSPLVKYTKLSPNHSGLRTMPIDTITIHCVVGHLSLQTLGEVFYPVARQASSNYGIDDNGNVGMYCEEKNRSWCTSSNANDQRAITIEVASDLDDPWAITDGALRGIIKLCADICQRNNIPKLLWKADKNLIGQVDKQNMTAHRWFAAKACPGDYMYNRFGYIADEVNKILGVNKPVEPPVIVIPITPGGFAPYLVKIKDDVVKYRKGPSKIYVVTGTVRRGEVYTIVEEKEGLITPTQKGKWGKLKSGAGWIDLSLCEKV